MRRRNAAETRDAILDAARVAFTHHGFDQVGVREITTAAGVNGSLVNRYFGTKERLFAEVMRSGLGFEAIDGLSFEQALGSLADRALKRAVDLSDFDPVLALIRSAPVETAQPVLQDYLTHQAIGPLADLIGGDHANERASLIVAILIGVIILRAVIKSDPLASTTRNDLASLIEQAVRCVAVPEVAGVMWGPPAPKRKKPGSTHLATRSRAFYPSTLPGHGSFFPRRSFVSRQRLERS